MSVMKTVLAAGAVAAGLALAGPGLAAAPAVKTLTADVVNNDGKAIGTATVTGNDDVTVIRLILGPGALSPGWHGIHLHAVGDCSDTAKFQASKAHVNHDNAKHGLLNPDGPDDGDLPNIFAIADGSVSAELAREEGLIGSDGYLDADGFALVIHANPDDHVSQPIGGAGDRVACAAFRS